MLGVPRPDFVQLSTRRGERDVQFCFCFIQFTFASPRCCLICLVRPLRVFGHKIRSRTVKVSCNNCTFGLDLAYTLALAFTCNEPGRGARSRIHSSRGRCGSRRAGQEGVGITVFFQLDVSPLHRYPGRATTRRMRRRWSCETGIRTTLCTDNVHQTTLRLG